MQLKPKYLLHLDFLAAVGASVYGSLVLTVQELAPFAEQVADPKTAFGFAALALVRWTNWIRKQG